MDLSTWDCCRTCLSIQSLHPVFVDSEYHEIYSNVIFTVTGLKMEMNDNLPQQMCSTCISFINDSLKFRKLCEESNSQLLSRLNDRQFYTIKVESSPLLTLKDENATQIDISHLKSVTDSDFRDYDDNITLERLKYATETKSDEFGTIENNMINTYKLDSSDTNENKKAITSKTKRKAKVSRKEGNKTREKCRKENAKKEVECEYCHKILTSKLSLRNHYKIHTGFDVVCEHCGKKFITRRLLLMHCRAKHGYEKTDKCSYCDYRASNAEQVKIHERLHTGERPYSCSECSAAFHRKSSYLQHVAIHLPEKTVQCDQCPARFKSVTLMRIHKNRHKASAYSFQCRVCEGSFARRRNVARHLLRVHNLQPEQHHIDRRKIG